MGSGKLKRRDSSSSCSSSSSSDSSSVRSDGSSNGFSKLKKKDKKDKKDKKNKASKAPSEPVPFGGGTPPIPVPFAAPSHPPYHADQHHMHTTDDHDTSKGLFSFAHGGSSHPPPPPASVPPQGRRFQTATTAQFPGVDVVGPAPFSDYGGEPVYVGSAIFADSVHPAKLVPHFNPCCHVPYGGGEHEHHGRFDLLPITPDMEWVGTSHGNIPQGRRPIDGGYESSGERLYHAIGVISGVTVPGKTAPHLGGANFPFGGQEQVLTENYWILCWRNQPTNPGC